MKDIISSESTERLIENGTDKPSGDKIELNSVAGSLFYLVFLSMVLPTIVGFITDAFHMRFLSEKDLGVLSLTNSFDSVTTFLPMLFPIGAQVVISKAVGRNDREGIARDYTSVMIGQSVLVVLLSAAAIAFRYQIVGLLGGDETTGLTDTAALIVIFYALGMFPQCLNNLLCILIYMEDSSRRGIIYSTLLGPFLNILGYVYVTVTGPSIFRFFTVGFISDMAAVSFLLLYKHRKSRIFRFDPSLFSMKRFLQMGNIGLPSGAEYLYVAIYEFVVIRFTIHTFSAVYLPVFEIEDDINIISESFVMAICLILVYRLGVVYGEGNKERIAKEIKNSWIICMALSVAVAIVCFFVYPRMVDLFVGDNGPNTALIKQNAVIDLYFVCLATPFYAANNIFTSVYEVRELVKHAHLNYALETCVLFILYSVVLSPLMGVTGLWAAYPAAEATTLIVNIILMILYNKRLPAGWIDFMFPGPERAKENTEQSGNYKKAGEI